MKHLRKLRAVFRRKNFEAEMVEEMRQHLERRTREKIADGMAPDEARYAAQREFGGVAQVQERCRDERRFVWLEQFAQDFRYAARQLRLNPGFAATAIAILALGIGATTAIFSVVDGMVLKPLPYERPGQLVQLFESPEKGQQNHVAPGIFLDWREQGAGFEGVAAYTPTALNYAGSDEPEQVNGLRMSANGLALLRARPLLGRLFAPDEEQAGKDKVVVLTYQLWQRLFGGDRSVISRTMKLNDENYTIVGVLPDGFLPFEAQQFVVPLVIDPAARNNRGGHYLRVLARLRSDVTLSQASAELDTIARRSKPLYPPWKREWGTLIVPMQEHLVQDLKPALFVLLGSVGLVLLIACTNVAHLLLAKASARQKEIAVRAALGASRGRIVRQLLAESIFLSLVGSLLGLLLAYWSVGGLRQLLGGMGLPRAHEVALDATILGLALVASIFTGIAFGLAPALQASRRDLNLALKDATRGSASAGNRLRSGLIVGEVALALMLLIGAGLMLHSFFRVVNVPPGFTPDRALTLRLALTKQRYPDNDQRMLFFSRLVDRLVALPGVETVGLTQTLPLRGPIPDAFFRIAGRASQPPQGYNADSDFCSPDYFRAMGIPVQRGRPFTLHEFATGAKVALINAAFARELFPGEDPISQHLQQGPGNDSWEIIGVVGDLHMRSLVQATRPMVYRSRSPGDGWTSATLVVRTKDSPLASASDIRRLVHEIDPAQPVTNVQSLKDVVAASLAQRRLTLRLLAAFAGVALLLAAIGLYGVIAFAVTQRTREFGIRLALGATRGAVLRLVLGHGVKLVGFGLVIGLAGAFGLTRFLENLLYEVRPTDPVTFVVVTSVLVVAALLASWLPARRAAKVDPMTALRSE